MKTIALLASVTVFIGGCAADRSAPQLRPEGTRVQAAAFDVVVYGGTSAGVVAALQAGKMGKRVALIEPGKHLGGLTSGGLGATDIGNKAAIGGLARDFYRRLGKHYGEPETWKFEPHVAETLMNDWARESGAAVHTQTRLTAVRKQGTRLIAIETTAGVFSGRMFIDATYEGDLMAMAGVRYTVGRESNSQYGETLNGVQLGQPHHQFVLPVDPYVVPGDPSSGLLPRIQPGGPGRHGQGDHRVQAYCFRMCLTQREDNRIPFAKPEGYDPKQYALLARYLQAADAANRDVPILNHVMMPNGKTDTNNNGAFSTDNIGMNYDYPDGDEATRRRIFREHELYQKGLMYFLANDPSVPPRFRNEVAKWGLCRDEFKDNGGWPHQLYIREARRMVSDYVMTQANCQYKEVAKDSVGLAAYGMDSHNVQRYARDGRVLNEGDVQVPVAGPYPISYRSIIPAAGQCVNLAVPVCLSASHIAFGSIRMEPVFMVLGQSAATAACLAIDDGLTLQELKYERLAERLLADGQILVWTGPTRKVVEAADLPGIVIDNDAAQLTGVWATSKAIGNCVGTTYLHDANADKGHTSARLPIRVPKAGRYQVRLSSVPHQNRAEKVPVTIHHADGSDTVIVNQRLALPKGELFALLGTYRFEPGREASVELSNRGTTGHVIVDAVQLLPEK